jgi:hypothetical protein
MEVGEFSVVDESADTAASSEEAAEIDLSDWEASVTVEGDWPAEIAETEVAEIGSDHELPGTAAIEIIDEMRFYLSHGMPDQARAVLPKLQALTHDDKLIAKLREEIEAAAKPPAASKGSKVKDASDLGKSKDKDGDKGLKKPEPLAIPEFTIEDSSAEEINVEELAIEEIAAEDIPSAEIRVDDDEPGFAQLPVVAEQPSVAAESHKQAVPPEELPVEEVPFEELPVAAAPVTPEATAVVPEVPVATPDSSLQEFVADLETSLEEAAPLTAATAAEVQTTAEASLTAEVNLPAPARVSSTPEPVVQPEAPAASVQPTPIIGDLVADLEASLGDDFLKSAPMPPEAMPAPAAAVATPAPPQITIPPLAASAAASASASNVVATQEAPAPAGAVASPQIHIPAAPPAALAPPPSPAAAVSAFSEETAVDLNDMFGELKQDLESGASTTDEDPETHYNLGVAFREMGLLDEAIGELQKTCQSIDHGHPFSQTMQAYTRLAQCFLDKGVPEAAARWYDKALNVPGIDGETRTALHYELGSAFETAGDRLSALKHFMNVYGSNIDYRDVAERIKALKS